MAVSSHSILNDAVPSVMLRMTTPMIVGILALMFFQAADTYFIGLLGAKELAAVSFTFPVTFTVTSLCLGLAIGASILLGQAIGKGDQHLAQHITSDSIFVALLLIGIVGITGYAFISPLFRVLGATGSTLPLINEYMSLWFLSIPLLVLPIMCNTLLRATGDTVSPSLLMLGAGIINAGLDPLLIFGWGWVPAFGIRGAMYASIASWLVGVFIAFYLLKRKVNLLVFSLSAWPKLKAHTADWLKISLPICVAHILTPVATGILTRLAAIYGDDAVAALGAGSRLESLSLVVTFALTACLSAFVAQNLGANRVARSREAIKTALLFSLVFQTFVYGGTLLFIDSLARVFSNDPPVVEYTKIILYIAPIGSVAYGLLVIISTAFNAAKRSALSLLISLIRIFVFFAPCAWLGSYLADFEGLLIGTAIGSWLGTVYAYYVYFSRFETPT